MNINEVKELIKAVSESELTAFNYEEGNVKIAIRKGGVEPEVITQQTVVTKEITSQPEPESKTESPEVNVQETEEISGNIVKSPLVGTAYLAPEEGAEPFVKVGDVVKKGQTLAIVEAMKLMNEIESDFDGVVKKVLVENAQTVEYGQPLFEIG